MLHRGALASMGAPCLETRDRLYLTLAPVYDKAATFSTSLVLQGTYPRPIEAFLEVCASSEAPKSLWRSIKTSYDSLIEGWQTKMALDSWFLTEMLSVQESVSRGEEPAAVVQDLLKRFKETYGKAVDTAGAECTHRRRAFNPRELDW